MRSFQEQSAFVNGSLALSLAPALTPHGVEKSPNFFSGHILYPQVFARGLLILADITATRYFKYVPVSERDPILTAQGDRLRCECFSACNGVYARLDLFQSGLDGKIDYGTTNVDIGSELRKSLTKVKQKDKLYVNIGSSGFKSSSLSEVNENTFKINTSIHEKPVNMPNRWIRALGNASQIHKNMKAVFSLNSIQAQMFLNTVPSATGKNQNAWVSKGPTGAKLQNRQVKDSVYISGLHRLSALKRILTDIKGMTFYSPSNNEIGHSMVDVELNEARITISLTEEAWQGYSGEGALLTSLAKSEVLEDAEEIMDYLEFNSIIDELKVAEKFKLSKDRVEEALTFLAVSGKLGYDTQDKAYFHRELPDDPSRILKDNPRLVSAKKLLDNIECIEENKWIVKSNDTEYRVIFNKNNEEVETKCTCTWYLKHKNGRGPCKHILAVQLKEKDYE